MKIRPTLIIAGEVEPKTDPSVRRKILFWTPPLVKGRKKIAREAGLQAEKFPERKETQ